VILENPPSHDHYTRFQRRHGAMTPENKLLLDELSKRLSDELSKRFEEQDRKWDLCLTERDAVLESKIDDLRVSQDARVSIVEKAAADLADWRPGGDGVVDDLQLAVKKLNLHYEHAAFEHSSSAPGIISPTPMAARTLLPDNQPTGPMGTASTSTTGRMDTES